MHAGSVRAFKRGGFGTKRRTLDCQSAHEGRLRFAYFASRSGAWLSRSVFGFGVTSSSVKFLPLGDFCVLRLGHHHHHKVSGTCIRTVRQGPRVSLAVALELPLLQRPWIKSPSSLSGLCRVPRSTDGVVRGEFNHTPRAIATALKILESLHGHTPHPQHAPRTSRSISGLVTWVMIDTEQ